MTLPFLRRLAFGSDEGCGCEDARLTQMTCRQSGVSWTAVALSVFGTGGHLLSRVANGNLTGGLGFYALQGLAVTLYPPLRWLYTLQLLRGAKAQRGCVWNAYPDYCACNRPLRFDLNCSWQWQDASGEWHDYAVDASRAIQEAQRAGRTRVGVARHAGGNRWVEVEVDLEAMREDGVRRVRTDPYNRFGVSWGR